MRQTWAVAERVDDASKSDPTNKVSAFPFLLVCAGLLLIPTPLRELLGGEVAKAVNVVAWFGLILALLSAKPRISFLKLKASPVLLALLMATLLALGTPAARTSYIALDIVAYVAPILIVLYAGQDSIANSARQLLPMWCWFLNLAVVAIAAGGIIDLAFGHAASKFFTELYGARSYVGLLAEERMVSFYGHALTSASIVLIAFCSNFLLSIVRRTRVPSYFIILYLLAMALTTSKSGIILLLAAIVLTSFRAGRWRNLLLVAVGIGAAYLYGVFDAVLSRFIVGFESGDITTGRNDSLEGLLSSGSLAFHVFTGQIMDTSDVSLIAALEYPILRFAFRYGIAFALLFATVFFVVPLFKLLQRGHRRPLVVWVAVAIAVNTYSAIAAYGDVLLLFSVTTMLALVIGRDPESGREASR